MSSTIPEHVLRRAAAVRLAVFDVDGVLTDGRLYLGDGGAEIKAFHVHDGHGIKLLRATGVEVGVITARRSEVVERRMASLGVAHLLQGRADKSAALDELQARAGCDDAATACVGDDLLDLPVLRRAGLAVAVADATGAVREAAHWCTGRAGGAGAAREVCELIMYAQGNLDAAIERASRGGAE